MTDPKPSQTELLNLFEFKKAAQARLTPMAYDYYASGAHDEMTLRDNRQAWNELCLRYKVMVDVSQRTTATEVLGHSLSMPVMVAPTAFHKMAHPEGELATARAAAEAGTVMILSSLSNCDVEDVVKAAETSNGSVFFQLYVYKDREATRGLVARAEAAGCKALVLTVDAPLLGCRERDVRNRFSLPPGLQVRNMLPAGMGDLPKNVADSGLAAYFATLLDQALTWRDVAWLCSISKMPVIVKGIVRGDDARTAVEHGASGVVVSNHGGRQLDTSIPTLRALPEVVEAVGDRATVWIDGGVRRGTDVIKAVAMGASAVLVGRPILWGLAVDGQHGVASVLRMLQEEIDLAMALCGCPTVSAITRDLIAKP